MSEHLRALAYLLPLAAVAFLLADALEPEGPEGALRGRRAVWFVLTCVAFVTGNFWVFALVAIPVLLWARGRDGNIPALFLMLLFLVPPVQAEIPGLGLVNQLFGLTFPRLLVLVLLLPLFPRLLQQPAPRPGGWPQAADRFFLAYLLVQVLLLGREASVTAGLRGAFYLFLDLFLPYYVFSRALDDLAKLRDAVAALVVAGLVLAAVGVFEASRHWLLYSALAGAWDLQGRLQYLGRSGVLRAMGSTGHAIALGFVMAICMLLYLPLRRRVMPTWRGTAMLVLLLAGLFSPLSRGPWLGAAAGVLLYLLLGERALRNVALFAGCGLAALLLLALLPFGQGVLDLVPFIGHTEVENIDYRRRLVEASLQLVWRDPLLGSSDYVQRLAALGMVQGQGIVDIVNSYVQVALQSGLAGLGLFAGTLLAALFAAMGANRHAARAGLRDCADLARSLAAAQMAVLVIIGSASSILIIPWVYWCLGGLAVACARIVQAATLEPGGAQAAVPCA